MFSVLGIYRKEFINRLYHEIPVFTNFSHEDVRRGTVMVGLYNDGFDPERRDITAETMNKVSPLLDLDPNETI